MAEAENALYVHLAEDGGIFAVWSGYPADAFVKNLRQAGFLPRIVPLHEGRVVRARAYVGRA